MCKPMAQFGIDFSDAESACDIDGAVLRYIDRRKSTLFNYYRKKHSIEFNDFLRLRRKTGWSIWELGRVLAALPLPQLTLALWYRSRC